MTANADEVKVELEDQWVAQLVTRLRNLLAEAGPRVALHEPIFDGREKELLIRCIDSGYVSSVGAYVSEFEEKIAQVCGVKFAVAVVNGTAALEIALKVADVSAGDEVIMPSFTFVATPNAAHHLGAVPHFVDIEERTLGLDPISLRAHLDQVADQKNGITINSVTRRPIKAVVPMHTFGHPVDLDGVSAVAGDFGLTMVEDAAEALGSRYRGKPCGGFGAVSALSFNGNKIVTAGGGGAIVTDDESLAVRARHLSTTAKIPHQWRFRHDDVGYNYRMPNINAALGIAQLEKLELRVEQKRRLAAAYKKALADVDGVSLFSEQKEATSNYWLNALILNQEFAHRRDALLSAFHEAGLLSRPAWDPMHSLPIYNDCPRSRLDVTEIVYGKLINLPSTPNLVETFDG